jgi:hypothetical protein
VLEQQPAESEHGQEPAEHDQGTQRTRGPFRQAIRRHVICVVMIVALIAKPFKFAHGLFPATMRHLIQSWDSKMMWTYILSRGKCGLG